MMEDSGKAKALDIAVSQLKKRYGEGSIMKMGDSSQFSVQVIPTGSLALDAALGTGGIPRGRITEIFGPEASGKTTLAQHVIAEAQRAGGVAAIVDTEHALDPGYAAKCGVDVDNLYISQPDTGEQALEIAEALVRSGGVDVVIIDSVAALVPRAEIEGEMGDMHIGLQARLMSQALRKLVGAIKRSNTAVIFTNQLRMRIGIMFGNPETTTGGNALKFYAAVRLDIRPMEAIKQGGEVIGTRTKVRVKKNKLAPPFKIAEFDIIYNEGISKSGDVLDMGTEVGVLEKKGAYYTYGEMRLGQGRENAKAFLKEHPEILDEIAQKVRQNMTSLPTKQFGVTGTAVEEKEDSLGGEEEQER